MMTASDLHDDGLGPESLQPVQRARPRETFPTIEFGQTWAQAEAHAGGTNGLSNVSTQICRESLSLGTLFFKLRSLTSSSQPTPKGFV
jgi:hypothetical protein